MNKIPLTNSPLTVLIDPADHALLSPHAWALVRKRSKHYAMARVNNRRVYMHRYIMGEPAGKLVDHEHGETIIKRGKVVALNSQRYNLRICTRSQNMGNQKKHADRKGKYKGVCLDKVSGRYVAQICHQGKAIKLGRFKKAVDAAIAYDNAAIKLFGEYAKVNFFK
jgi:hypothetical protein